MFDIFTSSEYVRGNLALEGALDTLGYRIPGILTMERV